MFLQTFVAKGTQMSLTIKAAFLVGGLFLIFVDSSQGAATWKDVALFAIAAFQGVTTFVVRDMRDRIIRIENLHIRKDD